MQNPVLLLSVVVSIFSICIQPLHSQQLFSVKGYIYNIETNEPVINANSVVTDSQLGTSSGQEGYFELRLAAGRYNIIITSLGFSDKEIVLRVPSEKMEALRLG